MYARLPWLRYANQNLMFHRINMQHAVCIPLGHFDLTSLAGGLPRLPLLSMAVVAAVAAAADDERTSLLTSAADDGSSEFTAAVLGIAACCFSDRASITFMEL